jgi:hypothetical protein
MNFTDRDKNFFTIVNQSGKYHLEKQIQNASDIYFTLRVQPKYFIIFGYYNLDKNVFIWKNKMNVISEKIVKNDHFDIFGTNYTLKKLFENEVIFDREYMNIIPYLMEALNENFNVIRIKGTTDYVYALTFVEEVKKTFNLTIFEEALFFYRNWSEENNNKNDKNNKNDIKKNYRYINKNKCEFECKEKLV